jgi:4-hydroxybenzoate polyprenyltransferase
MEKLERLEKLLSCIMCAIGCACSLIGAAAHWDEFGFVLLQLLIAATLGTLSVVSYKEFKHAKRGKQS